jgi:hypothetical protein
VLLNRLNAARLVVSNADKTGQAGSIQLSEYIKSFGHVKLEGASSVSGTASGATSVVRAGPCPGFQHLLTLQSLRVSALALTEVPVGAAEVFSTVQYVSTS